MGKEKFYPRITTDFDSAASSPTQKHYQKFIRETLSEILPEFFDIPASLSEEEKAKRFEKFFGSLPFIHHSLGETAPSTASFFFLAKFRANAFKFFFEMISNWIIPGKRVNVSLFYAVDFRLPDFGDDVYTLCEVAVRIENIQEVVEIRRNFPNLETEVRLGVSSGYYARRILEIKGFSIDQKTALIQEYITYLIKRLPNQFDFDVFTEMQHVLVKCSDGFKRARKSKHLSRIISIIYLFRRNLYEAWKIAPQKRHVMVKLFKERIKGERKVLGILVGIYFLDEKEILEDRHVLKAIRNYIPDVIPVEGSFFLNQRGSENLCTFYMEIEKTDGSDFSMEEMIRLRKELAGDLKGRVEHLMHPIFMPRNEEEIMRNALSLSSQIRFLQDAPQVFISFDEQTHSRLFFTVILVRVIRLTPHSIQECFLKTDTFLEYIHDWCRNVGFLRKRYPKEATVFRVALSKEMFLRGDHSIDLYKARQIVFSELERIIGPLRDFNGGMISKQNETLNRVRELLSAECWNVNDLLVENFFYSIMPAEMRSVIDLEALKTLFLMLLDVLEMRHHGSDSPSSINIRRELDCVYLMIASEDKSFRKKIDKDLSRFNIPLSDLVSVFINRDDQYCLGYIYMCDDPYQQDHFCRTIEHAVEVRYSSTK